MKLLKIQNAKIRTVKELLRLIYYFQYVSARIFSYLPRCTGVISGATKRYESKTNCGQADLSSGKRPGISKQKTA